MVGNTTYVSALDTSTLQLELKPLNCVTDILDDGLNIHQQVHIPICIAPHSDPATPNIPDQNEKTPNSNVTYLNGSGVPTKVPLSSQNAPDLNITYHAAFHGTSARQSVLRQVVIVVGTMSTISLLAFILRLL